MPAAFLALGDFMARLKNFDKAVAYLRQVEICIEKYGETDNEWADSMRQEVSDMLEYCKRESPANQEASVRSEVSLPR